MFEESNHNIDNNIINVQSSKNKNKKGIGNTKITSINMKSHFPSLKLNVPLLISSNDIFGIFFTICKKDKFQVIEME